jgi:hypothetical protein
MITRPCWRLDKKTLTPLEFYASISDAARSLGLVDAPCIYDCCKGKLQSWNGFRWRYATQKEIDERNKKGELSHASKDARRNPKAGRKTWSRAI